MTAENSESMDIEAIKALIPHRYPFLLLDRVVELVPGERIVALKNVTVDEPFFQGHFPGYPVMPGVLIVEAMAQATGLLAMESNPDEVGENSLYYFVGIDNARFKQPVEPGDQLHIEVFLTRSKRGIFVFNCEARVDDKVVATADVMCTARDFNSI